MEIIGIGENLQIEDFNERIFSRSDFLQVDSSAGYFSSNLSENFLLDQNGGEYIGS